MAIEYHIKSSKVGKPVVVQTIAAVTDLVAEILARRKFGMKVGTITIVTKETYDQSATQQR